MDKTEHEQMVMEVVLRFFQDEQWETQRVEGKPVLRAGFRGEHGTWVCYIRVDEAQKSVLFHSLLGMNIPPQYRVAVMEYITRANYGLAMGNFEMDLDRGAVRFRTSVEAADGELSVDMLRGMAYANVHTIDRYLSGFMAVVHGGLSPAAALARVMIPKGQHDLQI